jgi:hypothetical protein
MSPLSKETWSCVVLAYIGVSVILYLVTRFNATEWILETQGRFHTQFSIPNALWFSFAALVQQGSDMCPRLDNNPQLSWDAVHCVVQKPLVTRHPTLTIFTLTSL